MTEAEYAVLIEAWDLERMFPYAERHEKLVALRERKGAESAVNAFLVDWLVDGGKYEEAEVLANKLVADGPSAWSYAACSIAARAVQGPHVALIAAETALAMDPENVLALGAAAAAAALSSDGKSACEYAARIAAVDRKSPRFITLEIGTRAGYGDLEQARTLLDCAPHDFLASIDGKIARAYVAGFGGQNVSAINLLNEAGAVERHQTGLWLLQAKFLLQAEHTDEAEALLERALAVNPRCERAHGLLVQAAHTRGDARVVAHRKILFEASTPFRVALVHCTKGDRQVHVGRLEAAAEAFQRSIDSKNAGVRRQARLGIIDVRLRQRLWKSLAPLLEEFESESPIPTVVVLARAGMAGGRGDWAEAIRLLELMDEDDSDISVNAWLMYYLHRARRFTRLAEVAQTKLARPNCSGETAALALLGLYRSGEVRAGDEALQACLRRYPDEQRILWFQARRLKAKGDKKAARRVWRQLTPKMRKWSPTPRRQGFVRGYLCSLQWLIGLAFTRRRAGTDELD